MDEPTLYTHGDFDGVVSAALASLWSGVEDFFFSGPGAIRRNSIGERDIVCDLPHPAREVRAWFDHHKQNIEEAKQMGWSVGQGAAFEAPSAARVIFEHLKDEVHFPHFLEQTVQAADRVDSMDYASLEQWLADEPDNRINESIFLPGEDLTQARGYLVGLVLRLRDYPIGEVARFPEVEDRYRRSREHAQRAQEIIQKTGRMIPEAQICVIDFSEMKVAPSFSKNLAYLVFPEASAVLSIVGVLDKGRKTNDLRMSLSLNPFLGRDLSRHDCAEIFDTMQIGGGHRSAAGARLTAFSKAERLRAKQLALEEIVSRWNRQAQTDEEGDR